MIWDEKVNNSKGALCVVFVSIASRFYDSKHFPVLFGSKACIFYTFDCDIKETRTKMNVEREWVGWNMKENVLSSALHSAHTLVMKINRSSVQIIVWWRATTTIILSIVADIDIVREFTSLLL